MTMTKRSNHIPMLMKIERMNSHVVLRRSFCEKSESGRTMLQMSMIHAAHHHWPNTRFQKYSCSTALPDIQATWNSVRYARPTTIDVKRQSFAAASMSLIVMMCSNLKNFRSGMQMVNTIPMPEKMAPATKYGGKIVACQPGVSAIAKSNDTTECTESTSGVANAARNREARVKGRHSRSELRQPSESTENIRLRTGLVSWSRSTAMSGISPT